MANRVTKLCFRAVVRACSTGVKMPPTDFVPRPYAGPSPSKIQLIEQNNIPPALKLVYKKPLNLHQGYMQWLYDQDGKRYLDFFGGIVTVSVGHCHPKVVAALHKQIDTLWHTTSIYRHPKIYEYIEKLASKLPEKLKVIYLVNNGTDANDLATVLSKTYTGRNDIISLQSCYHGHSSAIMGLTATHLFRMPIVVPSGFHHAVLPDPYRGIWTGCRDSLSQVPGSCSCIGDCIASDKYIRLLEQLLESSVPKSGLAAFIAESIQGASGVIQFPKGYLRKAHELIKKHGGLFICDEVQTGFGRTGDTFWGFESHGIIPDIVTMAKGIGNGFPLAAVATTAEIAAAHDSKGSYFNTFGGNPLACTAGKAVLDVIEEEEMQQRSKELGKYFITQLKELQNVHPVIGDVRGKGLMLAIDLVVPGTKIAVPENYLSEIFETIKDYGVLVGLGGWHGNMLRITPPMCINKEDINFCVAAIDKALKLCSKYKKSNLKGFTCITNVY